MTYTPYIPPKNLRYTEDVPEDPSAYGERPKKYEPSPFFPSKHKKKRYRRIRGGGGYRTRDKRKNIEDVPEDPSKI